MSKYDPKSIEAKWQRVWEETALYEVEADEGKRKSYIAAMFPYPSGEGLHVGHVRNYSINDTLARYHRQRGAHVLNTIGWDAFGLPAENYAIKTGIPPAQVTADNIVNFKSQLKRLGMSYDWSREVNTTDPEYYKWTQWIFTQLYDAGLAYQAESLQWWCPECKTVLANEQVISGGYCWRHEDTLVEKKYLKQWFFKITAYADQLLDGLEELDWPEKIKSMQRNWIGRSEGANIDFEIVESEERIKVFTTRPDTIYGATYLVLAPEHPLLEQVTTADQEQAVTSYKKAALKRSDVERLSQDHAKTGVFTGSYARNPATDEQIPIWMADYVLMDYGTGAIMAVPAHDERDYEFAREFDIPVRRVIEGEELPFTGEGKLTNSDKFDGMISEEARQKITAQLNKHDQAEATIEYRMHDWLISRQRYWGVPIPIIHCDSCGAVPVPEKDLPVELPEVDSFAPTGGSQSVLAEEEAWVQTACPECDEPARRETDTMDGYACSSWYLLRYTDARNDQAAWDKDKADYWLPVDYYCGGDHAVSHLLYSRFWMHFFADQGWVSMTEPIKRLVFNGYINAENGAKMSKSKGNVVDPVDLIDAGYGADALRLYELFIAPYDLDASWDPHGIVGTYRFLNRVWNIVTAALADTIEEPDENMGEHETRLQIQMHRTIRKVTHDLDSLNFNTAIAALMEYTNALYKIDVDFPASVKNGTWRESLDALLLLLAPFAPHITEELWSQRGYEESIHIQDWPNWNEEYIEEDFVNIVIQINGKVRSQITAPADADDNELERLAREDQKIQDMLADSKVKKVVVVPGKLVNFVL